MRARVLLALLLLSAGGNAVLALAWLRAHRPSAVWPRELTAPRAIVTNILRPIRTNFVVRPQVLAWHDLESDDYVTYIRNLRSIGCPDQTVRDIIVADVNELFAHRRATEIITPQQQWWLSEPGAGLSQRADDQRDALDTQRRELLARLLGPAWELSGSLLTERLGSPVTLDGPLLGELPLETKQALRAIELRGRERERAYLQAGQSEPGSAAAAELARVRQQTREELAKVLTPAQLEEYLLRYSATAQNLRSALKGFEFTADEFRRLFAGVDAAEQELQRLGDATDPAARRARKGCEQKREAAIAEALGPDRLRFYQLNQDPVFQRARETAQQVGAPADAVIPMYQINQATDAERRRILNDVSLTPDEQTTQLAQVDAQRLNSLRLLLGEDRFRRLAAAGTR
jgi:hypothetical protein